MLKAILNFRTAPIERLVQLYFHGDRFIVAATHRTRAGVYYEQAAPAVLDVARPADLGTAFRAAFDACSVRDTDLSTWKKSTWPACLASGLRSVQAFEREYTAIRCAGLNPSNAVVRASAVDPADPELELSIAFNPYLAPEVVGGKLLQLARRVATAG